MSPPSLQVWPLVAATVADVNRLPDFDTLDPPEGIRASVPPCQWDEGGLEWDETSPLRVTASMTAAPGPEALYVAPLLWP